MTELKVEPLITQEEMAEILHCHITQVSMLREVGILPAIRTGAQIVVLKLQKKMANLSIPIDIISFISSIKLNFLAFLVK